MNQLTNVFKLLSDETRVRMMVLLFQQDLCVCDISSILDVPQSRVSKNLSKLRDLDLVRDKRKDRFIFYSLKKDDLLLVQSLEYIFDHKNEYPQISRDYACLHDKDKHYNHCYIEKD